MARIRGVQLPGNKRVEYGLTYLFGVGLHTAQGLLKKLNIDFNKRVKDLSDAEIATIDKELTTHYVVEGALRKDITMNIRRLRDIKSYRGDRHKKGLPIRGRTKTNARTRKGAKKLPVALKKKISKK